MVLQVRRWLPGREIVLLGDSSFAALGFLMTLARHGLTSITRLQLRKLSFVAAVYPSRQGRSAEP
jgi:hypothetical protein